jgi:hypothetical protein
MQRRGKHSSSTTERLPEGLWEEQRSSFKSIEFQDAIPPGYELGSRGIELRIEYVEVAVELGCERTYVCCGDSETVIKSVARIRLVTTEDTSVCVMVNVSMWISDSAVSLAVTSWLYKVPVNPIIQSKTPSNSHVLKTWQYIVENILHRTKVFKNLITGFRFSQRWLWRVLVLWDIRPCSPLKVSRHFGGTYHLRLKGRTICRARNKC